MSVFNINTLQKLAYNAASPERLEELQSYSDVYLKQSLANLGQRFSIKGDGVALGEFSIYELDNTWPVPVDGDFDPSGKLAYAYMIGTVTVDEDENPQVTLTAYINKAEQYSLRLNDEDYIVLDDDLYIRGNKPIAWNGQSIAYYGEGTLVTDALDDTWKVASYDMSSSYECLSLSFDNYDIQNGRINEGLHIYTYEDNIYATYLSYTQYDITTNVSYYVAYQYTYRTDRPEIMSSLKTAWSYIMDAYNGPVIPGKAKLEWTAHDIILALDGCFNDTVYTYNGTMDASTAYIVIEGDNKLVQSNALQWNKSLSTGFPYIRKHYNSVNYFNTNSNTHFKRRLVADILVTLYNNYLEESNQTAPLDNTFEVYIPYDYRFIYTCNSQNTAQIYSADRDVLVETTVDPIKDIEKITGLGRHGVREQLMICTACNITDTQEDIYSTWKYFVTYDNNSLVNDIVVLRMYVMPYINPDGYWVINNVVTSIYARGKDGGNPSIIIKYSNIAAEKNEILSTMFRDDLKEALDWGVTKYRVRPLDVDSGGSIGDQYHMMSTYMPQNISTSYIHENLVTFLENAIIMDISSVQNEIEEESVTGGSYLKDDSQLGHSATITTFWALSKMPESDKYYFTYVKQPDSEWAIDFNYLTDAEAIVRYYMQLGLEPDVYRHRWLVMGDVQAKLKNQGAQSKNTTANPVLINTYVSGLDDMFGSTSPYNNNTNLVPFFSNNVKYSGSYISGVDFTNIGRFFKFDWDEQYGYTVPVVSQKDYINEYYPNTRIEPTHGWNDALLPIMDFKEMFLRNVNTLNRYNILTADAVDEATMYGNIYYSYIGSTFDSADKSILHIGTGVKDINIGTKTMTDDEQRGKFKKQKEIDIDFDTIVLNGNVILPQNHIWSVYTHEDDPNNKMMSMVYDMAWIWSAPHSEDTGVPVPTYESLSYIDDVNSLRYFRIPKTVSKNVRINSTTTIEGKTTYVSYVNVNWLMNDVWKIAGTSQERINAYKCSVHGEPGRLTLYNKDNNLSYLLALTTDIADMSEVLYDYIENNNDVWFTKPGTLDVSYTGYNNNEYVDINIKEHLSTHSTAFSMYDGGDL